MAIYGSWLPLIPAKKGKFTEWETCAIVYGICAGPLLLLSIPRNAGFAVIGTLILGDLLIPVGAIAIARTMRPFLFALIGCSGYFFAFVYLYFTDRPTGADMGPLLMIPTIFAYVGIPALVVAIPFYIRVRVVLKRNRKD
jgi:hypothetical protein